jgi:hypothetical protein
MTDDWRKQFERQKRLRNEQAKKETERIIDDLTAARIASDEERERKEGKGYGSGTVLAGLIGWILGRRNI